MEGRGPADGRRLRLTAHVPAGGETLEPKSGSGVSGAELQLPAKRCRCRKQGVLE